MACPFCQGTDSSEVKFTWWGGLLGPKMFNLHKCAECGRQYNKKKGSDPTTGIVIYIVVSLVAVVAIMFLLYQGRIFGV